PSLSSETRGKLGGFPRCRARRSGVGSRWTSWHAASSRASIPAAPAMPAPHRPLDTYYPSECDRSAWVRGIFDRTAGDYDRIEHARVPAGVRLLSGSAEAIPVPDCSADFLSMGYALRHLSDLSVAFAEFYRVMRPGARLCLLEITLPTSAVSRALLKVWLTGF